MSMSETLGVGGGRVSSQVISTAKRLSKNLADYQVGVDDRLKIPDFRKFWHYCRPGGRRTQFVLWVVTVFIVLNKTGLGDVHFPGLSLRLGGR